MPFVTYQEIKNLIPQGWQASLEDNNLELFNGYEANASQLISDASALDIPAVITAETRPNWVIIPMAWIINMFIMQSAGPGMSEQTITTIRTNYDKAIAMATAKRAVSKSVTNDTVTRIGHIHNHIGVDRW